MLVVAATICLIFGLGLALCHRHAGRQHTATQTLVEQMRLTLEGTRSQTRRLAEDLFVLQAVLTEHHLFDDAEMARCRARLVETPRRVAQERDAITRNLGVSPTHLVVSDSDSDFH
jgi:hypothetical protein